MMIHLRKWLSQANWKIGLLYNGGPWRCLGCSRSRKYHLSRLDSHTSGIWRVLVQVMKLRICIFYNDFNFYFDQRRYAQSVWVAAHATRGCGNCLQVLWNFYPKLVLGLTHKYLFCDLLLITFSAFSIKFNKTGFLSLTEAGLQEIGRCDQVAIFRDSLFL